MCLGVRHTIEACDFEHDSCGMTLLGWERVVATYNGLSDHTIGSTIGIGNYHCYYLEKIANKNNSNLVRGDIGIVTKFCL